MSSLIIPKGPTQGRGELANDFILKRRVRFGGVLRVTRATGITTETCARPSWLLRIESTFLAMGAKVGHPLQDLSLSDMHTFLVGLVLQDLLAPRRGERMAGSSSQTPNPFLVRFQPFQQTSDYGAGSEGHKTMAEVEGKTPVVVGGRFYGF